MAVLSCMAIDLAISLRIAVVVMVAMGPMAVRGQLIRLRSSMRGNKRKADVLWTCFGMQLLGLLPTIRKPRCVG